MLAALSKCKVAALAGALAYTSPVTAENLRALSAYAEKYPDCPNQYIDESTEQCVDSCPSFHDGRKCVETCPEDKLFHVEGKKECLAACPPESSFFLDHTTTCVASITLHLSNTTTMNQLFYMQIGTQVGLLAVFFFLALLWKRSNTRNENPTLPLPASHFRVVHKNNASGFAHTSGADKAAQVVGKAPVAVYGKGGARNARAAANWQKVRVISAAYGVSRIQDTRKARTPGKPSALPSGKANASNGQDTRNFKDFIMA
jgi:hypothetical protein